MTTVFSPRRTRCTAIVMLVVWMMVLGVGLANACVIELAQGHHAATFAGQVTWQADKSHQPLAADRQVCLKVCADEQSATVNAPQQDAVSGATIATLMGLGAITVPILDPGDRPPPTFMRSVHERPVAIRYLRLTI